jgi:hypothetical protein
MEPTSLPPSATYPFTLGRLKMVRDSDLMTSVSVSPREAASRTLLVDATDRR